MTRLCQGQYDGVRISNIKLWNHYSPHPQCFHVTTPGAGDLEILLLPSTLFYNNIQIKRFYISNLNGILSKHDSRPLFLCQQGVIGTPNQGPGWYPWFQVYMSSGRQPRHFQSESKCTQNIRLMSQNVTQVRRQLSYNKYDAFTLTSLSDTVDVI